MTGKNATNTGKEGKDTDTRPIQLEVLSPQSTTSQLLAVEESVGEIKSSIADLNLAAAKADGTSHSGTSSTCSSTKD